MSTFEDAARIARGLPGTEETRDGSVVRVAGRNFAAVYPERVDPRKPRVPNYEVLVTWVADLGVKQTLLDAEPEVFSTTDHYDGYPTVLVRLDMVDEEVLAELLTDAWMSRAPKRLLDAVDPSR